MQLKSRSMLVAGMAAALAAQASPGLLTVTDIRQRAEAERTKKALEAILAASETTPDAAGRLQALLLAAAVQVAEIQKTAAKTRKGREALYGNVTGVFASILRRNCLKLELADEDDAGQDAKESSPKTT